MTALSTIRDLVELKGLVERSGNYQDPLDLWFSTHRMDNGDRSNAICDALDAAVPADFVKAPALRGYYSFCQASQRDAVLALFDRAINAIPTEG